jgi:hypothetical protein
MRTHVEFRSAKFPPYPGEENDVNPDLWGKRLAEYLVENLRCHGFETKDFYSEDWGWVVPICHEAFPMWVGCGHYQEFEDGYLVFIEPSKPIIRKGWFKKIDTIADVSRLADSIETILHSDPDIRDIKWWLPNQH